MKCRCSDPRPPARSRGMSPLCPLSPRLHGRFRGSNQVLLVCGFFDISALGSLCVFPILDSNLSPLSSCRHKSLPDAPPAHQETITPPATETLGNITVVPS